jgi:hypothetical protein
MLNSAKTLRSVRLLLLLLLLLLVLVLVLMSVVRLF